jgi:hypothetical protein
VEAYSVMHDRDGNPTTVRAALLDKHGARAWGVSEDDTLATDFANNEWVGRTVKRDEHGTLTPHD